MVVLRGNDEGVTLDANVFDLIPVGGRVTNDQLFRVYYQWVRNHEHIFHEADRIVIETQMRGKYVPLTTMLRFAYFDKVRLLHASTLCSAYGLPRKRAEKKATTKSVVDKLYPGLLPLTVKSDDIADAALMAHWGMFKAQ